MVTAYLIIELPAKYMIRRLIRLNTCYSIWPMPPGRSYRGQHILHDWHFRYICGKQRLDKELWCHRWFLGRKRRSNRGGIWTEVENKITLRSNTCVFCNNIDLQLYLIHEQNCAFFVCRYCQPLRIIGFQLTNSKNECWADR